MVYAPALDQTTSLRGDFPATARRTFTASTASDLAAAHPYPFTPHFPAMHAALQLICSMPIRVHANVNLSGATLNEGHQQKWEISKISNLRFLAACGAGWSF